MQSHHDLALSTTSHALTTTNDADNASTEIEFPEEIWLLVLYYLPIPDLATVAQVNIAFNALALDKRLWKSLYDQYFVSDITITFDKKYEQLKTSAQCRDNHFWRTAFMDKNTQPIFYTYRVARGTRFGIRTMPDPLKNIFRYLRHHDHKGLSDYLNKLQGNPQFDLAQLETFTDKTAKSAIDLAHGGYQCLHDFYFQQYIIPAYQVQDAQGVRIDYQKTDSNSRCFIKHVVDLNQITALEEMIASETPIPDELKVQLINRAIELGHYQIARRLIEENIDQLNGMDPYSGTPLHMAANKGAFEIAELLIEKGATPVANAKGETPLYCALQHSHSEIIRLLAPIENATDFLHHKTTFDNVSLLIENGTYMNVSMSRPALCAAAHHGSLSNVQFLIAKGACPSQTSSAGETPLHYAALNGDLSTVKFLMVKGVSIQQTCSAGKTPLHYAALNGHFDVVTHFIENGAYVQQASKEGETPLHYAALNGNLDIIKMLIANGASIHQTDFRGNTALHHAARNGHLDVVKFLIANGASLQQGNSTGLTPLHLAAYYDYPELLAYLVKNGADIKQTDQNGKNALNFATYQKNYNIIKYLKYAETSLDLWNYIKELEQEMVYSQTLFGGSRRDSKLIAAELNVVKWAYEKFIEGNELQITAEEYEVLQNMLEGKLGEILGKIDEYLTQDDSGPEMSNTARPSAN